MPITTIAVMGLGQMGRGIAQTAAQKDFELLLYDSDTACAATAIGQIAGSWKKQVEKGRIDEDAAEAALKRLHLLNTLEDARDADMVIECVIENAAAKEALFQKLGAICAEQTIFASNTSSISITDLARATGRPDRFIGMHFFNPVPAMKLVEVIRGLATADAVYEKVAALAVALGKEPVAVLDSPGFAVNRILLPMINEAIFLLAEGVASAEDIDKAMKLGCNHPMGPLALADLIGLDTCLSILGVLHRETGDQKYRACYLLRKMVSGGLLGVKSGRGFFRYSV